MSIVFESFAEIDLAGSGSVRIRPRPFGTNVPSLGRVSTHRPVPFMSMALGPVAVRMKRPLPFGLNVSSLGMVTSPRPSPSGFSFAAPPTDIGAVPTYLPHPHGVGLMEILGTGDVSTRRPVPFGMNVPALGMVSTKRPAPWGSSRDPNAGAMIFVQQSPGYISMLLSPPMLWLVEELDLGVAYANGVVSNLVDAFNLHTAVPTDHLAGANAAASSLALADLLHFVWSNIVTATMNVTATATPSAIAIQAMFERLVMAGGPGTQLAAANLIADAIATHALAQIVRPGNVTESLALAITYTQQLEAAHAIVESALLQSADSHHIVVTLQVNEHLAQAATPSSTMAASESVTEALQFMMTITLNGEVFLAWVMNAENTAVSTYTNYGFNSFAPFASDYYGCAPDGIYILEGEDDNGVDIDAKIRTGLSNLGSGVKKRIPDMYLGYTSDGGMVLKVITTDLGVKVENWYALTPRPASDVHPARIKIGRALKSVYYGYELHNVNGSDFNLDNVALRPLYLERRV